MPLDCAAETAAGALEGVHRSRRSPPLSMPPSDAAAAHCRRTVLRHRPARALVAARAAPAASFARPQSRPIRRCACRPGPGSHRSARVEGRLVLSAPGAAAAGHGAAPPGSRSSARPETQPTLHRLRPVRQAPVVRVVQMSGQLDRAIRGGFLWDAAAACPPLTQRRTPEAALPPLLRAGGLWEGGTWVGRRSHRRIARSAAVWALACSPAPACAVELAG